MIDICKLLFFSFWISAYYLNPKYQYAQNLGIQTSILNALSDVVMKPEPNADAQALREVITIEITIY